MKANIYFLKFNNYYNRNPKKFETLNEYSEYIVAEMGDANFNPGDGVDTSVDLKNWTYLNSFPDYVLVTDPVDGTIYSRWFVLDNDKQAAAAYYVLNIHRDLVSDNYEEMLDCPAFIEKATVSQGDVAIFNNENMSFNQIKQNETPLKDKSGIPWIVGYVDRNPEGDAAVVVNTDGNLVADLIEENKRPLAHKVLINSRLLSNVDQYIHQTHYYYPIEFTKTTFNSSSRQMTASSWGGKSGRISANGSIETVMDNLREGLYNNDNISNLTSYCFTQIGLTSQESFNRDIRNLDGKIVKIADKFYSCKVTKGVTTVEYYTDNGAYGSKARAIFDTISSVSTTSGVNPVVYEYTYTNYTLSYTELTNAEPHVTIPAGPNRKHLQDAPYDMFCIPAQDITINNTVISGELMLNISGFIASKMGSKLYDIQILPYCPLSEGIEISYTGGITIMGTEGLDYNKITHTSGSTETTDGYLIWCSKSKGTFDIPYEFVPEDKKISNECDLFRISSPNYNGVFEFSPAKNNGIHGFNVDWEYKPSIPYIHINPIFNGLYGQDFNDSRGLICGGDFSLARVDSAWTEYQNSNKTYQATFDRQIENMEVNNKYARTEAAINASLGTIQGGMQGAFTGSMVSPGIGTAVGAAVGTISSAASGITDMALLNARQAETLDFTKDMFGFNLQNIQARPYSLSKVSSINPNNKYFPFLEYYTCTETEKNALINKMKYNGMTVGRIGTIREFLQATPSYIKAKIIRFENFHDDYHALLSLAEELNKGVYI